MGELLGADTDVLDRCAASLSTDAGRLRGLCLLAQRAVAELRGSWNGPDLGLLSQTWEQQASLLLAVASASLDRCAAQLRAQSAAQRTTSSADLSSSPAAPLPAKAPPAPPILGSAPQRSATWWRTLSPLQQQQIIREHPDWIGNRDGVPFTVRDLANRALLISTRARLLAERERLVAGAVPLEPVLDASPTQRGLAPSVPGVEEVNQSLKALAAVDETLATAENHQLLLLDLSKERPQAAIARGDVDTADNVAVLVPGLSTTVSGNLKAGVADLGRLWIQTELESTHAQSNLSAATVMWIGYQAPQLGRELIGANSVARLGAARRGAAQLVPFLQGIGAVRKKDAHLTLLGHSYGSTTAGVALRQTTGVDDAVFFGSPGLGTSHLEALKLAPGHAYYIEARQDLVGDLGVSGRFGIDPSHLPGIEHASAKDSTVVDPLTGQERHLKEVTGHSWYLQDESTSQYNLSVVAAGLPDRRVRDEGVGVGDVLSWPTPGTY